MDYSAETGGEATLSVGGLAHIAYIKPPAKGESGWVVYNADGQQLAVFPTHPAAYYTARQYNLTPVNVH